ncbi:hypothetical protein BGZ49_006907 [Haplosporangium sp. Z 27]|nr:hypothetical protein BGZ49_006907 [Haplosporangium sp. Z 27]
MYPNPCYALNADGEGQDQEMTTTTTKVYTGYEAEDEDGQDVTVKVAIADLAPLLLESEETGEDNLGLVHTIGRYRGNIPYYPTLTLQMMDWPFIQERVQLTGQSVTKEPNQVAIGL